MNNTQSLTASLIAPQIDTESITIRHEDAGDERRYHLNGEVILPHDVVIDRIVMFVVGRIGTRFIVVDDVYLDVDNAVNGRLAFNKRIETRAAPMLDSIELRITMRAFASIGSARFQAADIPSAGDPNRGPVTASIGAVQLALQQRLDATDANFDVMGLVPGDLPGVTRIMVELACFDREGTPLFHDVSRSEVGRQVPHIFRESSYAKLGAWRMTDAVLVRLRAEFRADGASLTVPASAFLDAAETA